MNALEAIDRCGDLSGLISDLQKLNDNLNVDIDYILSDNMTQTGIKNNPEALISDCIILAMKEKERLENALREVQI